METENQQPKKEPLFDRMRAYVILYANLVVRGFVSLIVILIIMAIITIAFDLNFFTRFILAFLISILLAPIYSKINVGHRIIEKFESYLDNIFKDKGVKK